MGASVSSNTVDSMVKSVVKSIQTYNQTCNVSGTSAQNQIDLSGCVVSKGAEVIINNGQAVNSVCLTNATSKATVTNLVQQTMEQSAQAVVQNIAFGTVAAAQNFIKTATDLGTEISSVYNSRCIVADTSSTNTINCKNSQIDGIVEINNVQNVVNTCVQNIISNSEIYQKLINQLSQTASAQTENAFAVFLYVFVAILAIGAWFVISVARQPIVQYGIVVLVLISAISTIIYTANAKKSGLFPYKQA